MNGKHHNGLRTTCGFTFAELLAAMVFIAIVIPVAVRAVTFANRAALLAERKRIAAELASRVLTEKVVTDEWRSGGERQGTFGDNYPGYRWVLEDDTWSEDAMREVSVEVFFSVQGFEYSVRLTTLAPEEEQTASTTTGSS
ncbi:MAG: type II secretion system GspH family protein [Candidatus Sumerlaeia bacterium]|nr:type II secretion system GspH family protein [Candidatus Sumerlaeia bacterium]